MGCCSGHDQFEESTEEIAPLTEEEKKQRLKELREKMADKKANQALLDKEEQKKNEVRITILIFDTHRDTFTTSTIHAMS